MNSNNVVDLTSSELVGISGGGVGSFLGETIGDAMCGLKAVMNVYYNYWSCGCIDTGCGSNGSSGAGGGGGGGGY
ncbi:hypothetical protein [uncultured Imperialibacter sp.]|uniref:hypothetical protein n=1 Tax=uncultured Imperialibacter sp. TaxID=1672639 RepID=UPI0030D76444|tara:strand:- start:7171 stop:7395 length:225 start_codon:yes stop_codon:yes gene_type:complete